MIIHVDDFIVAFREDYPVSELEQMLTWDQLLC